MSRQAGAREDGGNHHTSPPGILAWHQLVVILYRLRRPAQTTGHVALNVLVGTDTIITSWSGWIGEEMERKKGGKRRWRKNNEGIKRRREQRPGRGPTTSGHLEAHLRCAKSNLHDRGKPVMYSICRCVWVFV